MTTTHTRPPRSARGVTTSGAPQAPTVGELLRTWRERRRLSQLELSSRAGVSTRHLSCVETGRAQPSPELIERLAEQLEVPLRSRDSLLLAGGYAPRHHPRGLEDAELAPVMDGLRQLLDAHQPYPALLLDGHWDVVDANAVVDVLLQGCDPCLLEPPINVVRLSLHPGGLAPRIRNLEQWAAHLLHQVRGRAEHTHDPVLHELADEAAGYLRAATARPLAEVGPVLALELEVGGALLRFFSVSARLETATDATLEDLHLETFLPADARTQQLLGSR
ncbi:helix-turn-helix transcriptional regulator [Terrabacter sp. NPDC080008]|uniref:helix-turn-helix domain-containing protein n=1 Tax=Terrabacter sp. NPDC080008 TaxID=3155176 RepID=UPI00344C8578